MSDVAVDSSVAVKWVLPESDSPQAEQCGLDVVQSGGRLIVLDFAYAEVANALWKEFHRGRLTSEEVVQQFGLFGNRQLHVIPAHRLLPAAVNLATRYDCAVYDALFVAMAADFGVTGVSADVPLVQAVRADHANIILLRDWPSSAPPPLTPPP